MSTQRYQDEHGDVHADGPIGDGTALCGDSLDGEDGATHMQATKQQITCRRCVLFIRAGKRIRASEIGEEARDA